jgi:NAD(P)-dependent dehydrogenase (short-subunit alcohol dehydrogenase family)
MQVSFSGKTAVVTGGANGIGLAVAREFAVAGAKVWVFDLAQERPGEVASGFGAQGYEVDVRDTASLAGGFDQAGTIDIVVACAGTVSFADVATTSDAEWQRIVDTNLGGVFYTVREAARRMKPLRRGSIVMIASTNSYDGEADLIAYNASKAGLMGILHTAANELGPYQIRVNAVCPGLIRTRLTVSHFNTPEVIRPYLQQIPMGRGGEPEEVARAVAFLASDLASFITGAALFVDGGQMAAKFGTWSDQTAEFSEGRWRLR